MEITTLNQLQEYAKGQIIELPPFAEGQPFFARIKRPSLMVMAKAGKIPNELLTASSKLFSERGGKDEADSNKVLNEMYDMFEAVCEACLVEPTYEQIKQAGVELTDDQKSFLFQYTQQGARVLENFRTERRNHSSDSNGEVLSTKTQPDNGD